jgi:thioredoxin reductase (NADPH)
MCNTGLARRHTAEGMWRNWYTRTIQNRIPKGLGVRVSPCPPSMDIFDAVIIGGGPAGASCALWLKQLGFNPCIIDSRPRLGGLQNQSPYINKWILTTDGLKGEEVAGTIQTRIDGEQIQQFNSCNVTSIDGAQGNFVVKHSKGEVRARFVVLASGVRPVTGGLTPSPHVLIGPGKDIARYDFTAKRVALLGGGDNAFENYIFIKEKAAGDVHLYARSVIARRALVERVPSADIFTGACVVDNKALTVNGFHYDCIVVLYGWTPQLDYMSDREIVRDEKGFVQTDFKTAETSIPGIYAIGELAHRMHPCVVTSMADGVVAAKAIQARIEK